MYFDFNPLKRIHVDPFPIARSSRFKDHGFVLLKSEIRNTDIRRFNEVSWENPEVSQSLP